MLRSVDQFKIQGVFKVFRERAAEKPQYVVLMKDRGFICTCLSLQNVGIVCRHVFLLLRQNLEFKYHISLIPRRWFHEKHQGLNDSQLKVRPFFTSKFDNTASDAGLVPPSDFMSTVHAFLPSKSQLPVLTEQEAIRAWRHSDITNKVMALADEASNNRETFDMLGRGLETLQRKLCAKTLGTEPVEDSVDVSGKGRFQTKRPQNFLEGSQKRLKAKSFAERSRKHAEAESSTEESQDEDWIVE